MNTPPESQSMPLWRRYWPILLLALLPVIPLYRAAFMGEAIGPFDQIRQMAPWNGAKPAQAWDVLQADGVLQFYVWRDLVFDAWGKGQMPFWNPYQLAGAPLLANSQSGAFYPPHILMGILHVPTATAMTLLAWFHLFWAGLGAYMLCTALGANKLGGFIGGASFALSSFMIAWTGLPSIIETVSWIPWLLAFAVLIFEENPLLVRMRTAKVVETIADGAEIHAGQIAAFKKYTLLTVALAVSTGMMILAGHLQFVAYGFLSVFLLLAWFVVTRRSPVIASEATVVIQKMGEEDVELEGKKKTRSISFSNPVLWSTIRVLIAGIIGLCIAAPQLLAVLQYSQFSHRKNSPTDTGYAAYVGSSIQPYELIKLIIPTIQGNPRQVVSDQFPISTYYPAVLKPGANFAESAIGIGAFGLLLVCLLPLLAKFREPVWGVMLLGAFGLLLALGTPLNRVFYYGVPGWSSTGSPGRAICLFVLAASIAAGLSASRLGQVAELVKAKSPRLLAALGGFAFICLICLGLKNSFELRPGLNQEVLDTLKSAAESSSLSSGLGISLLALFAVAFSVKEQTLRSKAVLLSVPILSCLAFFGLTLVQTGTPNLAVKSNMGMQRIAPINGSWDIFSAVHATLPPNTAALNRIHSLDGYDSLLHRDTVAMLRDIDGGDPAPPANGNIMYVKPKADWKKLADAGVTEVWSQEMIPGLGDSREEDGLIKYSLKGPGRASTPQGPAEITSESDSQLKLRAKGPGKLTIRDRNMPGWIAKVDGSHAAMGGTTWMEIEIPGGEHQVELNYIPPGFMTGVLLALPAWFIVLLLVLASYLRGRRRINPSESLGR